MSVGGGRSSGCLCGYVCIGVIPHIGSSLVLQLMDVFVMFCSKSGEVCVLVVTLLITVGVLSESLSALLSA